MPKTTNPEKLIHELVQPTRTPEMPRPTDGEVEYPNQDIASRQTPLSVAREKVDVHLKSPLGVYLKQNHLSEQSMARALGVALRTVQQLSRGEQLPTVALAYEVEVKTKGVVPMEAWIGTQRGLEQIREWRSKQPDGLKEVLQSPHEPVTGAVSAETEERNAKFGPQCADEYERQEREDG